MKTWRSPTLSGPRCGKSRFVLAAVPLLAAAACGSDIAEGSDVVLARHVHTDLYDAYPGIPSPAGDRVVFAGERLAFYRRSLEDGRVTVYTVATAGGTPTALVSLVNGEPYSAPDWSADGAFLFYSRNDGSGPFQAAVIEAAHAEGLAAVVHVSTLETALEAMAFGADGLVHVWRDEIVAEADAQRFAEADIFVVPTLSVMVPAEDSSVAELVSETDDAMLSPIQRQTLAARFPGGLAEGGDVAMENVRRLRAAGVRLVVGTDSPNPGTGTGISMHGELRLLARAGMGSTEALAAATSVAADAFGVAERGRIAEGHLADLVLVRGDLEEDVSRSHRGLPSLGPA